MDNTDFELVWRKKMVTALATYALRELRGDDMSATRLRLGRQVVTRVTRDHEDTKGNHEEREDLMGNASRGTSSCRASCPSCHRGVFPAAPGRNPVESGPGSTVRSSTTSVDSEDFTYAGQFKTLTNIVGADNLVKAIQEIWDSAICCHETEYHKRTLKGRTGCDVIIQEMISSKLAGVSFSKNPLTNQQEIIIEAIEGPGEDLVQKGLTPLRWKFRKNSLSEGDRDYKYISLISKIASDTLKLRRLFRKDVDIEWVFDGNHIYYLQFRQITGMRVMNIYANKLAKEIVLTSIRMNGHSV